MYKRSIYAFISITLLLSGRIYSQEEEGQVIIVSERVGETIDSEENIKYNLFLAFEKFQSAIFLKLTDGSYILKITYLDEKTGEKIVKNILRSELDIKRYREKIEHFEEMQAGTYSFFETDTLSPKTMPSDSLLEISLKDGTTLKGKIIQNEETSITVVTFGGLEIKVPKSTIVSIQPLRGRFVEGRFLRFDPNYSRLLFAPTGRPLRKGDGYFTDYYVFFPGIAYGLSDNISFLAGMSVIPGLALSNQLFYVAPRIGITNSESMAVSVGILYTSALSASEFAAGIGFIAGTFGPSDKSFTAGIGLGYTKQEGTGFQFAKHPIIMLGGNIRISNSLAFVTENWLITGDNFNLSEQPFGLALRFFGDRLAVDVGVIIIGEVLKEGFPIPWLSFIYNFGRQ